MKSALIIITKYVAYVSSITLVCMLLFELQFLILLGVFLWFDICELILIVTFIAVIANILASGFKKLKSYLPLVIVLLGLVLSYGWNFINMSYQIHYQFNKSNLELIDVMSQECGIYELTDMLRHSKNINNCYTSGSSQLRKVDEMKSAFGECLTTSGLNLNKVSELRALLESADVISLIRSESLLVLTIGGFVDNEYGYVKSFGKALSEDDSLPPHYFYIVRLIDLGDGWYFFYTT